jgi:hypothetical protein
MEAMTKAEKKQLPKSRLKMVPRRDFDRFHKLVRPILGEVIKDGMRLDDLYLAIRKLAQEKYADEPCTRRMLMTIKLNDLGNVITSAGWSVGGKPWSLVVPTGNEVIQRKEPLCH